MLASLKILVLENIYFDYKFCNIITSGLLFTRVRMKYEPIFSLSILNSESKIVFEFF